MAVERATTREEAKTVATYSVKRPYPGSVAPGPEHGQVWVDIFSCKGFDEIPAIDKIVDAFALRSTRVHKLERGLEYPHNVDASIPLNRTERREVTPV